MGGIRIHEPAADLPIALAVASAVSAAPLGTAAAYGEIGLTGELRATTRPEARRAEAVRMGCSTVIERDEATRTLVGALGAVTGDRLRPHLDVVR